MCVNATPKGKDISERDELHLDESDETKVEPFVQEHHSSSAEAPQAHSEARRWRGDEAGQDRDLKISSKPAPERLKGGGMEVLEGHR